MAEYGASFGPTRIKLEIPTRLPLEQRIAFQAMLERLAVLLYVVAEGKRLRPLAEALNLLNQRLDPPAAGTRPQSLGLRDPEEDSKPVVLGDRAREEVEEVLNRLDLTGFKPQP